MVFQRAQWLAVVALPVVGLEVDGVERAVEPVVALVVDAAAAGIVVILY